MPPKSLPSNNPQSIFGEVETPAGVALFDKAAGGGDAIGILVFISTGIRLFTIIAGLYVLANFILAGYAYITAGDSKAHQEVREKLTNSVLGLVIIVAAYTIIALIGLIFFGKASYIINPEICGPLGCSAPVTP